jgi:hypothetical protein
MRGRKVYHERLPDLLCTDLVHADIPRRDWFAGATVQAELTLAAYGPPTTGGEVRWRLTLDGADGDGAPTPVVGRQAIGDWPTAGSRVVGQLEATVPEVTATTDARLELEAVDASGTVRARDEIRLAILPASTRRSSAAVDVHVVDPQGIWDIAGRLGELGHRLVEPQRASLIVASELTNGVVDHVEAGGRALVLIRSRTAIPDDHDLARRVAVHLRRLPHSGWPGQRSPWEGDWVTSWSWILPELAGDLPRRAPLDFAYEEVLPDHVLLGHDARRHRDEVTAGMFVGWIHTPAALVWRFRQGSGSISLTTFRIAPERGPVATALLERLVQAAAA